MSNITKDLDHTVQVLLLGNYDARTLNGVIETILDAKKEIIRLREMVLDFQNRYNSLLSENKPL